MGQRSLNLDPPGQSRAGGGSAGQVEHIYKARRDGDSQGGEGCAGLCDGTAPRGIAQWLRQQPSPSPTTGSGRKNATGISFQK